MLDSSLTTNPSEMRMIVSKAMQSEESWGNASQAKEADLPHSAIDSILYNTAWLVTFNAVDFKH